MPRLLCKLDNINCHVEHTCKEHLRVGMIDPTSGFVAVGPVFAIGPVLFCNLRFVVRVEHTCTEQLLVGMIHSTSGFTAIGPVFALCNS